jgi:hypothetical protein
MQSDHARMTQQSLESAKSSLPDGCVVRYLGVLRVGHDPVYSIPTLAVTCGAVTTLNAQSPFGKYQQNTATVVTSPTAPVEAPVPVDDEVARLEQQLEQAKRDATRRAALSKLTPEERAALNLPPL